MGKINLYAAIRPRFGVGPRTAVYAGLFMWVVIGLLHALGDMPMGLWPQKFYVNGVLVALVQLPVGARPETRKDGVGTGMATGRAPCRS